MYCHGFPASRLEAGLTGTVARELRLRVVAPDRPGYGASDHQTNRGLTDWPRHIAALADALMLDRFSVLGVSGGGPYALACAALLVKRVIRTTVVCGLGPMDEPRYYRQLRAPARAAFALSRHFPNLAESSFNTILAPFMRRRPEQILTWLTRTAAAVDREILRIPEVRNTLVAALREAFAQGGRGAYSDLALYSRPWNFDLHSITAPVHLWHGGQDRTVPLAVGEHVAASLVHCRKEFLPSEGHYSLPIRHMRSILMGLLG